jgi:hypothetical protein
LRYGDLARIVPRDGHNPEEISMFTSIGLPQFGLIVLVLVVFIIYTQRHRF